MLGRETVAEADVQVFTMELVPRRPAQSFVSAVAVDAAAFNRLELQAMLGAKP